MYFVPTIGLCALLLIDYCVEGMFGSDSKVDHQICAFGLVRKSNDIYIRVPV